MQWVCGKDCVPAVLLLNPDMSPFSLEIEDNEIEIAGSMLKKKSCNMVTVPNHNTDGVGGTLERNTLRTSSWGTPSKKKNAVCKVTHLQKQNWT